MKGKRTLIMFSSALLLIGAIIVWFSLDAVKLDSQNIDGSYSFIQLTFGYKLSTLLGDAKIFKFSILNLLGLIVLVLGALVSVLSLASKKGIVSAKADHVLVFLISAISIAAVFFVKDFAVMGDGIGTLISNYKNGLGVYLIAGLSGASALLNLVGLVK